MTLLSKLIKGGAKLTISKKETAYRKELASHTRKQFKAEAKKAIKQKQSKYVFGYY